MRARQSPGRFPQTLPQFVTLMFPTFSPDEVDLLRRSFLALIPALDNVTEALYSRLFAEHPEVRAAFPTDLGLQRDKLIDTLASLLDVLDRPSAAGEMLEELGRRHQAWGATPELYAWVGESLEGLLVGDLAQDDLEDGPRLRELWRSFLGAVVDCMLSGTDSTRTPARV